MASHKWGRAQKYFDRPRHLYALLFGNGCCYIGQTVDPKDRLGQHRSSNGGWGGQHFEMVRLGVINGTFADAERYEFAWRFKAVKAGWYVYGKPGILINPKRRLTSDIRMLASSLKWPKEHRRNIEIGPVLAWLMVPMGLIVLALILQ